MNRRNDDIDQCRKEFIQTSYDIARRKAKAVAKAKRAARCRKRLRFWLPIFIGTVVSVLCALLFS